MKIDLEREEFLQRLDLRIGTLSALVSHIEKVMGISYTMPKQSFDKWQKQIDDFHIELIKNNKEFDKKIIEYFEELKKIEKREGK